MTTENGFSKTTIQFPEGEYMERWIFQCRWFTVRLHKILLADEYRPHNHPWNFVSMVLKGSYVETIFSPDPLQVRTKKVVERLPFRPVFRSKDTFHRVTPTPAPVWTFVVTGPKRTVKVGTEQGDASWCFLNDDGSMTHWRYSEDNRPTEDASGVDLNELRRD